MEATTPVVGKMLEAMGRMDFEKILTRQDADKCLAKSISDCNVRRFLLQNLYWTKDKKLAWKMNLEVIIKRIDEVGKQQSTDKPFVNPCLFVAGSESDYVLDEDFGKIKQSFPNCRIERISGANHWVHVDRPAAFSAVVMQFLHSN